ncbi:MAG: extracellular solute-binding protein [Clostridia bacterium]|nr:extracellular solute-binding protein [Clostridia bacterium]
MKKVLAMVLALCMVLTASMAMAEKVEFFQQKMEEGPQRAYAEVLARFHAENPDIEIEINTIPDAGTVLMQRISTGDIPPIFSDYPTQTQFKGKVNNGYIECLEGNEFLSRVNPGMIELGKHYDGQTYALPLSQNYMAIFYNIDIFEQVGIEGTPKTWDELIAVCDKLVAAGVVPFSFGDKDAGRVGHCFQALSQATYPGVVDYVVSVVNGEATIADNADSFRKIGERMLKLHEYALPDYMGTADTVMWENFATGKAAMCITGSYARGTILISNPDLNLGAFPIPGDVYDESPLLTGIDAALCISAEATEEQKAVGLKFLEFISRPENAQLWSDIDGAPSCLLGTTYSDPRVAPVIEKAATGVVCDWYGSKVTTQVTTELYQVVQGLLLDGDLDAYIEGLDEAIEAAAL